MHDGTRRQELGWEEAQTSRSRWVGLDERISSPLEEEEREKGKCVFAWVQEEDGGSVSDRRLPSEAWH